MKKHEYCSKFVFMTKLFAENQTCLNGYICGANHVIQRGLKNGKYQHKEKIGF